MENISIYSPVDGELLGTVPSMTPEHIDGLVKNLQAAFVSFKELSVYERAKSIKRVSDVLEENQEKLAKLLALEISKPYKDALSEVKRSVFMTRYTIEEALRLNDEIVTGVGYDGSNKKAIISREPLGLILCIAPFNYPINLSLSKIIPALLTGNVVLFKPPTQGSLVCSEMVKLIKEVLPSHVLEIVTGRGSVIGDYINNLKEVKAINFTGSTSVGMKIAKAAVMKGLIMELGGKDAAIVLSDANLEKAASQIVSGAFSYSGQRCTAIKRVLVEESVSSELVELIRQKASKLKVGNPMEDVDITPLIDTSSADYVEGLIKDAIDKGAKLVMGGKRIGNTIYPTLLDDVSLEMEVAFAEPFGPVLPIIRVKNSEEAVKIANMSEYGLQSSVFTSDTKTAFEIAKKLEVGTVHINNKTQRGPDNFPFLGIKNSGFGVQGVKYSLESMTKIKSIVIDF